MGRKEMSSKGENKKVGERKKERKKEKQIGMKGKNIRLMKKERKGDK